MTRVEQRIGLLGAGFIAEAHAKALEQLPHVKLVSVCDASLTRAEQVAARFGASLATDALDSLLASECDAVHVLLPPPLHGSAAKRVLEARKHVFLEKPMGIEIGECEALIRLAEARNLRLGVNHNYLFVPAYERLRRQIRSGELGPIEHVAVNWQQPLGLLQEGPLSSWMLQRPTNLFFELGPHPAAFIMDLVGLPEELRAMASSPLDLPNAARVWRSWNAVGQRGETSITLNLSVTRGPVDRSIHVRGQAATAHIDYERDLGWIERRRSNQPLFGSFDSSRQAARAIGRQSRRNLLAQLAGTLRGSPKANVFGDSIGRSIERFYAEETIDARQSGSLGADVIRLCQSVVNSAGITSAVPAQSAPPPRARRRPTVLVVGGTGFIGTHLVTRLSKAGRAVRVLTRNLESAQIALQGLDVELMLGSAKDADRAMEGIDEVYYLAKGAGRCWQDYVESDIAPTKAFAEAAIAAKVRRFVYTGTIDSYDSSDPTETITADTPLDRKIGRRNHYARSKAACERLLLELHRQQGLPLVVLRPGIVIGAGTSPEHWGVGQFVGHGLVRYWGDGRNPLPFVLVEDVADALVSAGSAPGIEGEAFLLTDEPFLSARDYVSALRSRSGLPVREEGASPLRLFFEELIAEAAKHAVRHPNRRRPSLHDWACRSHRARYDSAKARDLLSWNPAETRQALIERGIWAAVDRFIR